MTKKTNDEELREDAKNRMTKEAALTWHRMTEEEKHTIHGWRYAEEYAIYNMPPYEEYKKSGAGFANPDFVGYAFYDENRMVGFTCLYPEADEVMVGAGVAPEYCDKGYGQTIIQITCDLAQKDFPEKTLYLEVRTWNARAIQCYNKAGFVIDGDAFRQTTGIGEGMFYRMIKNAQA